MREFRMHKGLAILCVYIWFNGFASSELLQNESFSSFFEMVARITKDAANRVFDAGSSDNTHYLFLETCLGVNEWQYKAIDINHSSIRQLEHDRRKWLVLKDNDDYKFQDWDFDRAVRKFVIRLPQNSALVSPKIEWYYKEKVGHYKDGKPLLVCNREYEVYASLSPKLKRGDCVSMGWLVDDYSTTTNILSCRKLGEKIPINNKRILYMTWDDELISQRSKDRYFYISDSFPVPIELVWDSDLYHETLIPFDEKKTIDAYAERATNLSTTRANSISKTSNEK